MEAARAARTASPAMAEGIERDSIADFETGDARADLDDFAGGLVAENDGKARDHALGAEFPIDDVQVGAANAARADANQQRGFGGRRHRGVDQLSAGSGTGLCDCLDLRNLRIPSIRRRGGSRQRKPSRWILAETGKLFPVAQRSAAVAHARADETIVGVLLERVRNPSRRAANREDCRGHRARKAERADAYGEVEVEVGAQALAFEDGGFDF